MKEKREFRSRKLVGRVSINDIAKKKVLAPVNVTIKSSKELVR